MDTKAQHHLKQVWEETFKGSRLAYGQEKDLQFSFNQLNQDKKGFLSGSGYF